MRTLSRRVEPRVSEILRFAQNDSERQRIFMPMGVAGELVQRHFAMVPDCFASLAMTKLINAAASDVETDGDDVAIRDEVVPPFQA